MGVEEVFFAEWDSRGPADRRSLGRARRLSGELGLASSRTPILTIVGSKGKGTAAAYASAYLAAAGQRVLTITSPGYRSNRERIRLDGLAISSAQLALLADQIARAVRRLPAAAPGEGYLAPSGQFTLAGMVLAMASSAQESAQGSAQGSAEASANVDAIVLEAGRGGRSDEASLFPPTVAAITPIFEEHLGELGSTVEEIAADKAGIVTPLTRAALSAPQRDVVLDVLRRLVAEGSDGAVTLESLVPDATGIPRDLLPRGFGAANAELGCMAAQRLLDLTNTPRPPADRVRATLASIELPGRLSWHRLPGSDTTLLLDQAVTRAAAATALTTARLRWPEVDHVLVSLPDDKDLDGVIAELDALPVTFVELDRPHLRFTRATPPHWARLKEADLSAPLVSRLGSRVVALGTVSFVALLLELLDVSTARLFSPQH